MPKVLGVLTLALMLLFSSSVMAQQPEQNQIQNRLEELEEIRNNPEMAQERANRQLEEKVFVRGQTVNFDVPPVIENGRTLIPVRAVTESLGADVDWDADEQLVTISRDGTTIEMVLGETEVKVDGESHELDVPGRTTDGRTLVPLRFISELLGDRVDYREETGEIDIGLVMDYEDQEGEETGQSPQNVVEQYWELYVEGNSNAARNHVFPNRADELGLEIDLDQLTDEDRAVLERFELEALDDQTENDTAIVEIEFTKPNFHSILDRYYEEAYELAETTQLSENEFMERLEELMTELILEAETISYEEEIELRRQNGAWKIYDFNFDNMERRWEELRKNNSGGVNNV